METEQTYRSLDSLRRQFEDFRTQKAAEQREQREARLYYHGSQWTAAQLKTLKDRGQPPVTTPRLARKINGFVGMIERQRADPKAYPRTQKEDQGAELATAALRYAFDQQEWAAKSPIVSMKVAVDSIGGFEISLEPGDSGIEGDFDISMEYVEPESFFYDPRSFKYDFSDARFMGVAKWLDVEDAKGKFPEAADEIDDLCDNYGGEFVLDNDRDVRWVNSDLRQIFVVEHWYKVGNAWLYTFYCGTLTLLEGRSYLQDEKGRDECRFVMVRAFIDQDGDSYSFHRYLK